MDRSLSFVCPHGHHWPQFVVGTSNKDASWPWVELFSLPSCLVVSWGHLAGGGSVAPCPVSDRVSNVLGRSCRTFDRAEAMSVVARVDVPSRLRLRLLSFSFFFLPGLELSVKSALAVKRGAAATFAVLGFVFVSLDSGKGFSCFLFSCLSCWLYLSGPSVSVGV